MDPQVAINEVVNSVKSEGLFDQFRKECLDEFENMETYNQLKQTVENHVASFLSRRRFSDNLQKNSLRGELRNHLHKSEVLINGIQRLVDEVLSLKGHGFCLKIDKQVDEYLNPPSQSTSQNEQETAGSSDNSSDSTSKPLVLPDSESVSPEFHMEGVNNEVTEIEEVDMDIESDTGDDFNGPMLQVPLKDNSEEFKQSKDDLEEANNTDRQEKHNELPLHDSVTTSNTATEVGENSESQLFETNPVENENTCESKSENFVLKEEGSTNHDISLNEDEKEMKSANEGNALTDEKLKDETKPTEERLADETEKVETTKVLPEIDQVNINNFKTQKDNTVPLPHSEQKTETEAEELQNEPIQETFEEKETLADESATITEPSYYSTLITEPITDESSNNSMDSFEQISEPSDSEVDNNDAENETEIEANRRKSHRKRNVPLKYREDNTDETTSPIDKTSTKSSGSRRSVSRKTQGQFLRSSSVESKSTQRASSRTRKSETESNSKRKRSRSTDQNTRSSATSRPEHNTRSRHESPEERSTKRPRRSTKQRERYSPS